MRLVSLVFFVVSLAAVLFTQGEATKGPKITHKVYFDIKHGEKELGRGQCYEFMHQAAADDV